MVKIVGRTRGAEGSAHRRAARGRKRPTSALMSNVTKWGAHLGLPRPSSETTRSLKREAKRVSPNGVTSGSNLSSTTLNLGPHCSSGGHRTMRLLLAALVALGCCLWPSLSPPVECLSAGGEQHSGNLKPANNEKPFASMLSSAVINGKASLPCDISPANPDDSVALILWYKDDSLAPIYTIDARKANSLDRAKTSLDEAYTNRATFNMRTRPAQLQLEAIRQEDEGEYRCRVDFKRGRTVNTIISLRVVVLPDEVRIVAPERPHIRLQNLIGPFNEGSELTLLCIATGGKPRPQITWRRDFNVIDETYQHVDKEGTSNELKIPSLNKNHLLSVFTCQASNNNITSPMQASITLDLNLKPGEVSLRQLVHEPLVVGQSATFECLTHGSRPQASIHWIFQNTRHDTPMNVDQQQTSTRLTLTIQQSFNQQPLTCVAENPRMGPGSALSQTIKLDVHYPPQLSIKLEPSIGSAPLGAGQPPDGRDPPLDNHHQQGNNNNNNSGNNGTAGSREPAAVVTHLQEGNDIYLTCQLDANPRPLKPILWRFNGRPLQQQLQQGSSMIVMNNQSLVLRKVTRQQSGSYTCDATNQHGSSSSQPMELIIRHAPVCSTDDILVFEAAIGQTVSVDCNVLANPTKSVHYSWFLAPDEQNLTNWTQRDAALDDQIDESSSRLKFKIKDENGFALLKCKAKNDVGLQQRACLFRIVQAQVPQLKHTCRLSSAVTKSLQLRCEPSEHLKSEDFELTRSNQAQDRATTSGGLNRWLGLDTFRVGGPQQSRPGAAAQELHGPGQKLSLPVHWLLVELHKWRNASSSESSAGQHDLVAYVIVSASQQLAQIKSLVEENRLFGDKPRAVYYVAARPTTNQTSPSGGGGGTPDESSSQLASSFAFTVPNLDPASSYKLLIYGQNLANKTRDWLAINGETLGEETASSSRPRELVGASLVAKPQDSSDRLTGGGSQQQKSLVMRSGDDDADSGQQAAEQAPGEESSSSLVDKLTGPTGLNAFGERLHQLGLYRDHALTYAKQKPLVAASLAITSLIVAVLVIILLSNGLISLLRKNNQRSHPTGEAAKRRRSSSVCDKKDSNNSSSKKGLAEGDANGNSGSSLTNSQLFKSSSENSYTSTTGDANSPPNHNSAEPLIKNQESSNLQQQQQQLHQINQQHEKHSAVYTIGSANFDLNHYGGSEMAGRLPHAHSHHVSACGSLDRRNLHSAGPIYLAEPASRLVQLHSHQIGSIDRRVGAGSLVGYASSMKQQPLLLADLHLANGQGFYLGEDGQVLGETQEQELVHIAHQPGETNGLPNSASYCDGSFSSSNDYNGSLLGDHSLLARSNRNQRVAFDLSNQQQQQQQYLCSPDEQHQIEVASRQPKRRLVASPQQQQFSGMQMSLQHHTNLIEEQSQQVAMLGGSGKGSDSSGSNSGNTADSGLESPATGETNSLGSGNNHQSQMNGACATHRMLAQCYGAPTQQQQGRSARPTDQEDQAHLSIGCCPTSGEQQHQQANLVMLMELSPGSQESSATLMHSVDDSFGEIIQQQHNRIGRNQKPSHSASSCAGGIRFLSNNHQLATSFTSNSGRFDKTNPYGAQGPIYQAANGRSKHGKQTAATELDSSTSEARDVDNWL